RILSRWQSIVGSRQRKDALQSRTDTRESCPLALSTGTRLGSYEILAPLGVGGMGEVYRARDPRLGRDVAIKVLPAEFCANADRVRRFEQEARAAASLSHPNILAVHDISAHGRGRLHLSVRVLC